MACALENSLETTCVFYIKGVLGSMRFSPIVFEFHKTEDVSSIMSPEKHVFSMCLLYYKTRASLHRQSTNLRNTVGVEDVADFLE